MTLTGPLNSLSSLFAAVLRDCAVECHTDPTGDIEKGIARFEQEGLSFFTLTLPCLAEALETGLRTGLLDLTAVTGFARHGGLPLFLGGFLRQVFDCNGRLLDDPSIGAIASVRQICLMWKKIQLPCGETRTRAAFETFIKTDSEVPDESSVQETHPRLLHAFDFVAGVLWTKVLSEVAHAAEHRTLIPRHGPGATAEKIRGNTKYLLRTWHERLEDYFPWDQNGVSSPQWCQDVDLMSNVSFLSPGAESPVRVITVPKTMKGPRVIAIEPVCMQYVQQGLMAGLVQALESNQLTRSRIGFTDQSVNQKLAIQASKDQSLATLDLKEASDRVPFWGVKRMLRGVPHLWNALEAARSTHADVPGHGVIHLRKFASMGSATCFPIEAMFFFTVILAGMLLRKRAFRARDVKLLASRVTVYGDDIIVPVDQVEVVVDSLQALGLVVNTRKSFWTGKFRESCGMDAYDGERVTPVYVRSMSPTTTADVSGILSWVSLGNQLYQAGLWGAAQNVRLEVEKLLGPLPMVDPEAGCLGWHNVRKTVSVQGWDKHLQRFAVRAYTTRTVWRDNQIDGQPALMKCLLESERRSQHRLDYLGGSTTDEKHLSRTVKSVALSTKRRWVSPA